MNAKGEHWIKMPRYFSLTVEGHTGKSEKADQVETLDAFKAGDIDVLVSSTVVEVAWMFPAPLCGGVVRRSSAQCLSTRLGGVWGVIPSPVCYMVSGFAKDENARE